MADVEHQSSQLTLPNELFITIFEFVAGSLRNSPMDDPATPLQSARVGGFPSLIMRRHEPNFKILDKGYAPPPRAPEFSQLLALRTVCRQFRALIDALTIWSESRIHLPRDQNLGFLGLQGETYANCGTRRTIQDVLYPIDTPKTVIPPDTIDLEILWPGFTNSYGEWTSHTFSSIDVMSLSNNTVSSNSTLTTVNANNTDIDFGLINSLFPILSQVLVHRHSNSKETLQSFPSLRSIDVSDSEQNPQVTGRISLPTASRAILTHLCFSGDFNIDSPDVSIPLALLNEFPTLQHLQLEPLSLKIIEFMRTTELHLVSFGTNLNWMPRGDEIDLLSLAHMLMAPSLRSLQNLSLEVGSWKTFTPYQNDVIAAITSNLVSLRTMLLEFPVDIKWATDFMSLRHLEFVEWVVVSVHTYKPDTTDALKKAFEAHDPLTNSARTFEFRRHI
jgi:F-box domain